MPTFDRRAQRNKLLKSGILRLLATTIICSLLVVTLYEFEQLDRGMTNNERRGFNTLIVLLSMTLNLVLFHSLEGCAQVVRWRILASKYSTPKEFELIYEADRKMHSFRLLWASRTRRGGFFSNKVQLLAAFYLLISIGLLVDTAVLGLTYSIEVSPYYKMSQPGTVSVANLTTISPVKTDRESHYQQAQNYGLMSQGFVPIESSQDDEDAGGFLSILYDSDADVFWYRFVQMSTTNILNYDTSDRYITSRASCREVTVVIGGNGGRNSTDGVQIDEPNITIQDGDEPVQELYIGELQTPGGITWLGSVNMGSGQCGPRCAHLWALQSSIDTPGREKPRFWKCTNTVSQVFNAELQHNDTVFQISDHLAQIMAGAIGFSGVSIQGLPYQRVLYPDGNAFAPSNSDSTPHLMESTVMWFSAGAFAAMDAFGPRIKVHSQQQPIAAQVLDVNWKYAALVLGIPPFAQALVLMATIIYGNKIVVGSGSTLFTARLLRPVLDRVNGDGSLTSEKQDVDRSNDCRIKYRPQASGVVGGTTFRGSIPHVDIEDNQRQRLNV